MIDTNILFAVLIKSSVAEQVLFNPEIILYAPKKIFEEFVTYKKYLLEKTHRPTQDFFDVLYRLQQKISVVTVREEHLQEAMAFTPDAEDVTFLALATQLNIPLWSNDKRLKQQNVVRVYSTHELFQK